MISSKLSVMNPMNTTKVTRWINIYPYSQCVKNMTIYSTKEQAEANAESNLITTIKIEWDL